MPQTRSPPAERRAESSQSERSGAAWGWAQRLRANSPLVHSATEQRQLPASNRQRRAAEPRPIASVTTLRWEGARSGQAPRLPGRMECRQRPALSARARTAGGWADLQRGSGTTSGAGETEERATAARAAGEPHLSWVECACGVAGARAGPRTLRSPARELSVQRRTRFFWTAFGVESSRRSSIAHDCARHASRLRLRRAARAFAHCERIGPAKTLWRGIQELQFRGCTVQR